jgi:tetratricopeptide (TPR) repeat protein
LARSGNVEAALPQLEQALALDPDNLQANLTYGTLLAQRGRDAEATVYYRKALSIQPELKDAHFNLGNALLRMGESEPAAKHFQSVLELDPANSVARYGLGVALVRVQRWPEAAAALEQAFAEQPDSQLFGNTLVRLLAACPDDSVRDGERAFKLADQLVRKERSLQNAEILAMALAEVGRFAEAVKLQENALNAVRGTGQKELEARLAANLALYRAGRPCRTP